MPIEPTNPIEVPEVVIPLKVADQLWITSLRITAPSATKPIEVEVCLAPFISSTGEILIDMQRGINIPDLSLVAQSDETVGAAVQAIYAAVQKLAHERNLF